MPSTRSPNKPLYVYNGGFLTDRRIGRILSLAGWDVRLGAPSPQDRVGIWGASPTSGRGTSVAQRSGAGLLTVEDAPLRGLHPGRSGGATLGLCLDQNGLHFDPGRPSDLEMHLANAPLDDGSRARAAIERLRYWQLSKFAATIPDLAPPAQGSVIVVDQARDDASVAASGADQATFDAMLQTALDAHPGKQILIKQHPETALGTRQGYFLPAHENDRVRLYTAPISPWRLFEGAEAVYTVSSGLGLEAIWAGLTPHVLGGPFYAGWGLSRDVLTFERRSRTLTPEQLFEGAMINYPVWYDPASDKLCDIETAISTLEAQARAWRQDRAGHVGVGMRLWKRGHFRKVFATARPVRFASSPKTAHAAAKSANRDLLVWGGSPLPAPVHGQKTWRVEDGFLRSKGLGAQLVPPLSLIMDDRGLYFDPSAPSLLEALIEENRRLPLAEIERIRAVVARIQTLDLTKYNISGDEAPRLPEGHKILVIGQVEDDASIRLGTSGIKTNAALLRAARAAEPDAHILYKPHPDVEAGLRIGVVSQDDIDESRAIACPNMSPGSLMGAVDELWTMTSTMGFEALLRGLPVTCAGAPFYAGWGLTSDHAPIARRTAKPSIEALAHAALIGYPRYFNPNTGDPMPIEAALDWLAQGRTTQPDGVARILAKLQGLGATLGILGR
ncbi:MAG: capsular polysaccharide biosynthesis protein [Pseudomonadota bacterium]